MTYDTRHVNLRSPPPPQGLPGGDTGGVKKTSPMKGKVFFTGDRHTHIHTHGHCDFMTESAQWAESVKILQDLDYPTAVGHSLL